MCILESTERKKKSPVSLITAIASLEIDILTFMGEWMALEDIMLSEISQMQNDKYGVFSLMCGN